MSLPPEYETVVNLCSTVRDLTPEIVFTQISTYQSQQKARGSSQSSSYQRSDKALQSNQQTQQRRPFPNDQQRRFNESRKKWENQKKNSSKDARSKTTVSHEGRNYVFSGIDDDGSEVFTEVDEQDQHMEIEEILEQSREEEENESETEDVESPRSDFGLITMLTPEFQERQSQINQALITIGNQMEKEKVQDPLYGRTRDFNLVSLLEFESSLALSSLDELLSNPYTYILDSGATKHICANISLLKDEYEPRQKFTIKSIYGNIERVTRIGSMFLTNKIKINGCHFLPNAKYNLVSVSRLCDFDVKIIFTKVGAKCWLGGEVFMEFHNIGGLFIHRKKYTGDKSPAIQWVEPGKKPKTSKEASKQSTSSTQPQTAPPKITTRKIFKKGTTPSSSTTNVQPTSTSMALAAHATNSEDENEEDGFALQLLQMIKLKMMLCQNKKLNC
jgi:hypothetical protein